eukprot:6129593-Amphidinium_carterae.1
MSALGGSWAKGKPNCQSAGVGAFLVGRSSTSCRAWPPDTEACPRQVAREHIRNVRLASMSASNVNYKTHPRLHHAGQGHTLQTGDKKLQCGGVGRTKLPQ